MHTISAKNLNDAFLKLSKLMLAEGKPVTSRGMATFELHPVFLEIRNPTQRFLSIVGRRNNPMQTIYETLWVLSGRNDIEALSYYLPRAKDYSDNGKVWRGGYGPRLFDWNPDLRFGEKGLETSNGTNQVQGIVEAFKKDRATRQAVIQIWDPDQDGVENESKDRPCTNYLHFMARDGKLDLMVVMRSNDLLWGFSSINVFEWTFLQEIIANLFDLKVGSYYHVIDSLHIYTEHVERLVNIINTPQYDIYLDEKIKPTKISYVSLELFCREIKTFTSFIDKKNKYDEIDPVLDEDFKNIIGQDPWLGSAYEALRVYHYLKEHNLGAAVDCLNFIKVGDIFAVTAEYIARAGSIVSPDRDFLTTYNDLEVSKKFTDIIEKYRVAKEFILHDVN